MAVVRGATPRAARFAAEADGGPPVDALVVPCRELRGRTVRVAEDVLLYVDILGVALVDPTTRLCEQRVGFPDMTSWCATSGDTFVAKCFGRAGKLEERTFATSSGAAPSLQLALERRVQLYVDQPLLTKRAQAAAATFREGDVLDRRVLRAARTLGDAEWYDASSGRRGAHYIRASARHRATDTPRPRVVSSTSESHAGGRLARAGARARAPAPETRPENTATTAPNSPLDTYLRRRRRADHRRDSDAEPSGRGRRRRRCRRRRRVFRVFFGVGRTRASLADVLLRRGPARRARSAQRVPPARGDAARGGAGFERGSRAPSRARLDVGPAAPLADPGTRSHRFRGARRRASARGRGRGRGRRPRRPRRACSRGCWSSRGRRGGGRGRGKEAGAREASA